MPILVLKDSVVHIRHPENTEEAFCGENVYKELDEVEKVVSMALYYEDQKAMFISNHDVSEEDFCQECEKEAEDWAEGREQISNYF